MPESTIVIRGFKGLNIRDESSVIDDRELSQCDNFDLQPGGHLTKRYGWDVISTIAGAASTQLLGHFITPTLSRLILSNGSKVFYSTDGITWVEILLSAASISNVVWGVQFNDKFYLIRSNSTIIEYNGTTTTALTGSPSGTFAIVHKDRLFVINSDSATIQSRVFFSEIADFATWPTTNSFDIRQGDGEPVITMAILQDVLLIFKLNTTWALYVQGEPANWERRNINTSVGCTSKFTPREIDGWIYFVSVRGVYKTDGVQFIDISTKIESILRARFVNAGTINLDAAAWWEDKYIVFLNIELQSVTWAAFAAGATWASKSATTWGNVVQTYFVYHLKVQGWTRWIIASSIENLNPTSFLEVRTETPIRGLYAGDARSTGYVFTASSENYTDNGDPYVCEYITKTYDFELPLETKRGKWLGVDVESGVTVDVEVGWTLDNSLSDLNDLTTIKGRGVNKFQGPGFFRTIKFRVFCSDPGYFAMYGLAMKMHTKRALIPAAQ